MNHKAKGQGTCNILSYKISTPALSDALAMLPHKEHIIFPSNIIIQDEKVRPKHITFILSGALVLSYTNDEGKRKILDIAGPDEILGLSNCIMNTESVYRAKTIGVVSCLSVRKEIFKHFLDHNRQFTNKIISIICSETERKERKVYGLQYQKVYERLCSTVVKMKKIFGTDRAGFIQYVFNDEMLNQMVSTNTFDLYQAFERMEENKLASYRKGLIEVKDIQALRHEVDCNNRKMLY